MRDSSPARYLLSAVCLILAGVGVSFWRGSVARRASQNRSDPGYPKCDSTLRRRADGTESGENSVVFVDGYGQRVAVKGEEKLL